MPTTATSSPAGTLDQPALVVPAPAVEPSSTDAADKLYIVTRADLSPGYQAVQAAHAVADWTAEHPESADAWRTRSNSLIVLTADDEPALYRLVEKARTKGIGVTTFREPDLCDEITAVAFSPSDATRRLCSNQPLVGRGSAEPDHPARVQVALDRERRVRDLAFAMQDCEQTPGQDVLVHGRSVREHYIALVEHLNGRLDLSQTTNWRLPDWVSTYRTQLAAHAGDPWAAQTYLTVHDCGKPSVLTVTEDGRRQFPGHADASARVYRETHTGPDGVLDAGHELVADLIAGDMDIHLLKAAGVQEFCANPNAITHLLAGLAEVTSNAAMFGGVDSTSFKIKYKQLNSRGKAICAHLFDTPTATPTSAPAKSGGAK